MILVYILSDIMPMMFALVIFKPNKTSNKNENSGILFHDLRHIKISKDPSKESLISNSTRFSDGSRNNYQSTEIVKIN